MKKNQLLWIILAAVVIVLIAIGVFMMAESPARVMKSALKDVEAHRIEKVMERVDSTLADSKKREFEKILTRITDGEEISAKITKDESWREREEEIKPTKKYFASNYRAEVELIVDGELNTMTFRLKRSGATDEYKFFSFLFKPWVITNLKLER